LLFGIVLVTSPTFAPVYAGLFALVLMHEFGHALAGKHLNYTVHSITLYPIGGLARMDIPVDPRQELFVALAGPAVNAVLVPIFLVLPDYQLFTMWGYCNIMILVFNLVPALPMDGGRVFRSLLAMALNDHHRATVIAARVSQVICVLMGIFGLMYGMFMLAAISFLIFLAASGEIEVSEKRRFNSNLGQTRKEVVDVVRSADALSSIQKRLAQLDK